MPSSTMINYFTKTLGWKRKHGDDRNVYSAETGLMLDTRTFTPYLRMRDGRKIPLANGVTPRDLDYKYMKQKLKELQS